MNMDMTVHLVELASIKTNLQLNLLVTTALILWIWLYINQITKQNLPIMKKWTVIQMTNRQRLTELIEQAERKEISDFITADIDEKIDMSGGTKISCSMEYLVGYLLEHRVIVPPCKVGQTVYYNDNNYPYKRDILTFESTVSCFDFDFDTGEYIAVLTVLVGGHFFKRTAVKFTDFGETVFLTKEQAEQKLKEIRVENDL